MPYGGRHRQEKSESFSNDNVRNFVYIREKEKKKREAAIERVTDFKSEMEKVHGANKEDGKIELFNGEHSLAVHSTGKILYPIEKFGRKRKKIKRMYIFSDFAAVLLQCTHTISLCLYISADSCFSICQDDVTFI